MLSIEGISATFERISFVFHVDMPELMFGYRAIYLIRSATLRDSWRYSILKTSD